MPSELQRVAQQLLTTLDAVPRVVAYLHDRANKYRESAGWIGSMSSNPSARTLRPGCAVWNTGASRFRTILDLVEAIEPRVSVTEECC